MWDSSLNSRKKDGRNSHKKRLRNLRENIAVINLETNINCKLQQHWNYWPSLVRPDVTFYQFLVEVLAPWFLLRKARRKLQKSIPITNHHIIISISLQTYYVNFYSIMLIVRIQVCLVVITYQRLLNWRMINDRSSCAVRAPAVATPVLRAKETKLCESGQFLFGPCNFYHFE